jgi:parvulin-like peptidyl-prolyl isomerase
VLARLIDEELLYQEALRQGLDRDPKVKKVMVNTLLRQEVYGSIRNSDFTDEQLEAYYESHKDEFVVPEKVQIKRILIKAGEERSEDEARSLAAELRAQVVANPASFKEVATRSSEDPYRRRGGDVGFVPREGKPGLEQDIVDRAFDMEVDQISEVFQTAEGFNIIQIANKRERVERTYQQMKGSVLRKVKNEKLSEMYDQYTAGLRSSSATGVEVKEAALADIEVKSARRAGPGGMAMPGELPDIDGGDDDGSGDE